MKLLSDTHLLVWAAKEPKRLSKEARRLLDDRQNQLFFSAVSIWEIAIKQGLNRPDFSVDAQVLRRRLLENGFRELSITSEHALEIRTLPPIHADPFDRMLVAQAISEGITLLTADKILAKYPGPIRKV